MTAMKWNHHHHHTHTRPHTHTCGRARVHTHEHTHIQKYTLFQTHTCDRARAHTFYNRPDKLLFYLKHIKMLLFTKLYHTKWLYVLLQSGTKKNGSLLQTAFDTTDDHEVLDIKHSQEPVAMCFFTSDENHSSLPPFGINRIKTQCSPCLLPTHTRTSPWRYHFNAIRLALVWCFYLDAVIICST